VISYQPTFKTVTTSFQGPIKVKSTSVDLLITSNSINNELILIITLSLNNTNFDSSVEKVNVDGRSVKSKSKISAAQDLRQSQED
jgi:hypothetical protein